jgi:hypothetical protein
MLGAVRFIEYFQLRPRFVAATRRRTTMIRENYSFVPMQFLIGSRAVNVGYQVLLSAAVTAT